MQKEYIKPIFEKAIQSLDIENYNLIFDVPKNLEFGDFSTNIAMQLAKPLKKSPREIAEIIISKLEFNNELIEFVNIAGAGFINIKFSNNFYQDCLKSISKVENDFGKQTIGNGKKVNVEYVSANPTGLLHLGHGRNACTGDTVANLFEWLGYEVTREYYFNNAGNQMNNLGKSVFARYMQIIDDENYPFPEDGYHGEYVKEIAQFLVSKYDKSLAEKNEENLTICRKKAEEWCFDKILNTLGKMKIKQDIFYNEDSLYTEGKIARLIEDFKSMNLAYQKDGALWLKLTELGLDDDRVIVKSTGEPTYRLPDIAYHREKLLRGYDLVVDVFGADHIATVPDVLAGIKALGFDTEKVKILIHQFVTLTENGVKVKMSKRTGKSYTLDDLLDEVGADVVRFFLLMRGISTHLEFDLSLAREQSDKNPVFYLQYAHARISSIFDKIEDKKSYINDEINYSLLNEKAEIDLIKRIIKFPEVIESAGIKCEPHHLTEYLRELAGDFHIFYHNCRILGVEQNLQNSRLKLAEITKNIIKNGLTILGISAPERM